MSQPARAAVVKQTALQAAGTSTLRVQRTCACGGTTSSLGGECEGCHEKHVLGTQHKLAVGPADDHWEREADRIADQALLACGCQRRRALQCPTRMRQGRPTPFWFSGSAQSAEPIRRRRGGGVGAAPALAPAPEEIYDLMRTPGRQTGEGHPELLRKSAGARLLTGADTR